MSIGAPISLVRPPLNNGWVPDVNQSIRVLLANGERIDLNLEEIELWKRASPIMNSMLSYSFKERKENEIRLPEINGDVLKQISLMLREPSIDIGEGDIGELFRAVNFLQIESLEKKIVDWIKDGSIPRLLMNGGKC